MNGKLVNFQKAADGSEDAGLLRARMCQAEFQELLKKYNCTIRITTSQSYVMGGPKDENLDIQFVPLAMHAGH